MSDSANCSVPFPTAAAELTDAWLEAALRTSGALPNGHVAGHEWQTMGEPGQMSEVVQIRPRYADAPGEAPQTLIAKFAAPHEAARAQSQGLGLYSREIAFYREVGSDPGIDVPVCYAAEIDTAGEFFVLLLEDLGAGRNGDPFVGRLEDVELAVERLAPFHARWWGSERLGHLSCLRAREDLGYYRDLIGPLVRALEPMMAERFAQHYRGPFRDVARGLAAHWDEYWPPQPGESRTFVHVDYHPKQIFFPTEQGGRFAVFDWQSSAVFTGGMDLHRILVTGLEPAQLRQHQQRLIEIYHGLLAERGVSQPLESLLEEYRRSMVYTVLINMVALCTSDVSIMEAQAAARGVDLYRRLFDDLSDALELNRVAEVFER